MYVWPQEEHIRENAMIKLIIFSNRASGYRPPGRPITLTVFLTSSVIKRGESRGVSKYEN